MSTQHSIVDDATNGVTDLVSLEEQLNKAKEELRAVREMMIKNQSEYFRQQATHHRELTKLREQLSQTTLKLSEQEEKFDLYWEIKLAEEEEELNDEWAEKMRLETVELRQERDKLRQDTLQSVLQNAIRLHEFNAAWFRSLTAILANTINNQDIPSDLLRLPAFPQPIPHMQDYHFGSTTSYVFAEVYTGPGFGVCQSIRDEFRIIEVLCWTNNVPVPSNIPTDSLGQIAWLEANLLEKIKIRQIRDTWVLLAFSLLSKMVISDSWPVCYIAAFRLAVLKRQYLPHDSAVWDLRPCS